MPRSLFRHASVAALAAALGALLVLFAPAPAGSREPAARAAAGDGAEAVASRAHRRVVRLKRRARKACRYARRARTARTARRERARHARRRARARRACRRHRRRARRISARIARRDAPVLRTSGEVLSWKRVRRVRRYVLATKIPGRNTRYRVVRGTRVRPPRVPGAEVTYGLRTDVRRSQWAREVSIRYPETSSPVAPARPAAPPNGGFEAGVVSGSDRMNEVKVTGALGARLVRVEFSIGKPVEEMREVIAAHAANGTRVLPLAGFHGDMPTVAEARNLGSWAHEFGPGGTFWAGRSDGHLAVTEIEFGNETAYGYQYGDNWDKPSYTARAREYALRFRDAHEAVRAANPAVGLLAQGDDANTGSANWVNAMFDAVPDLARRVAGWTIHPYGPREDWQPRLDRMVDQLGAHGGASIPFWITEWGLSTDDGRCLSDNYDWDPCMTFDEAAGALSGTVSGMRERYGSRIRAFIIFQARDQKWSGYSDDREHYFGALRDDLSPKGSYTRAVLDLLAS